jgi:NTE family protein
MNVKDKRIALVLSGGGARGLAHIGVIQAIERMGGNITSIAGVSMGALVGGLYAANRLKVYTDFMLDLRQSDLFTMADLRLGRNGLIKGEKILGELDTLARNKQIEKLKRKFVTVATDWRSREEVVFRSGNLVEAIRASCAIPGLIAPVVVNDRELIDGAIANPLPMNHVNRENTDLLVAVNCNAYALGSETAEEETRFNRRKNARKNLVRQPVTEPEQPSTLINLLNSSLEMITGQLGRQMLKQYPPDLYLEFPKTRFNTFDFHRASSIIRMGEQEMLHKLK